MIRRLVLSILALTSSAFAQDFEWFADSYAGYQAPYTVGVQSWNYGDTLDLYKEGLYMNGGFIYVESGSSDKGPATVGWWVEGTGTYGYSFDSWGVTVGGSANWPTVSVSAPSSVTVGQSFTVTTSTSDPDCDLDSAGLRWQGYGLQGWWSLNWACSNSSSTSITAPSTPGTIYVRGEVWDKNGHGVAGDWVAITVNAIPTSFSFSGGSSFTYNGGTKSISVSASPSGATYSTSGTYSAVNAGSYTAYATATGSYSGSASHSWTINQANQSSVSSADGSISIGQSFFPNFSGGSGSGAWEWYVSGHTSWNDNSWTPPSPGNYTFYVRKEGDENFYDSNIAGGYTLSVTRIATSFSFSGGPNFTYDGNAKSVSVSASPGGATYNTSGTYSATGAGSYTASVSASGNYTGSDSYGWTIAKANQPNVSSSNATITLGSSFSPNYSGGAGTGSWQWYVSDYTSWGGGSWTPSSAGSYTFYVRKLGDSNYNTSNTAGGYTLTVNPATSAPAFTSHPSNQTVISGANATFNAAASGNPTPTYQWQRKPAGGSWSALANGGAYSGVTSTSLTVSGVGATMSGDEFRCVATNSQGSATSNSAILTVNTAPAITTQPQSQTVATGSTATFTVVASGSPLPTYQWRKNGSNISGATAATLTLSNVQSSDAATYSVVATNAAGSTTSINATLTVTTSENDTTNENQLNIHLPHNL